MAKDIPPVTFMEKVVRITRTVTLSLIGFVVVIIVLALIFGSDENQEAAEAQPKELVPAPAATGDQARSEPPEPEPVATEPEPEPPAPEPELAAVSKAILALFVDLYGFRNHLSFQRKGFAGGLRFQEWRTGWTRWCPTHPLMRAQRPCSRSATSPESCSPSPPPTSTTGAAPTTASRGTWRPGCWKSRASHRTTVGASCPTPHQPSNRIQSRQNSRPGASRRATPSSPGTATWSRRTTTAP